MKNKKLTAIILQLLILLIVSPAESADTPGNSPRGAAIGKPFPSVSAGDEIPDWVARLELARVLSYAKRYDEAAAEYRKLLAKKPDLHEARTELANVLAWQGNREGMRNELEKLPMNRIDDKTKLMLAESYMIQKEYGRAEAIYMEYLARHADDLKVRLKLAEILSWEKKYDASLAEYEKILKVRPDDVQVRRKYSYVLIWKGNIDQAANELRKTLK